MFFRPGLQSVLIGFSGHSISPQIVDTDQASYGVSAAAVAEDAAEDVAKVALKGGRSLDEMLEWWAFGVGVAR